MEILNFTGESDLDSFLSELAQAEKKLAGESVGLGYFLGHWRSVHLNKEPKIRRSVLNKLLENNWLEAYDSGGGNLAVRFSDRGVERLQELTRKQAIQQEK